MPFSGSKLNLKDTPSERQRKEDKAYRRAVRQARREARHGRARSSSPKAPSSSARRRASPSLSPGPRPPPPSTSRTPETEFEEHLRYLASLDQGPHAAFDAFDYGDSGSGVGWGDAPYTGAQRLPTRWSSRRQEDNVWDDPLLREPGGLDDESYAESIRQGMWERKNPGEKARRERLGEKAERTKRRLEEAKREGDRLERERIKELERRKGEKSEARQREERTDYERRWAELAALAAPGGGSDLAGKGKTREIGFVDVPWPVYSTASGIRDGKRRRGEERAGVDWMTVLAVRDFLLPAAVLATLGDDERRKKRKDILRDAIRRYHPDKFTRYLALVPDGPERARVKAGVDQVARVIGDLMSEAG